MNDKEGVYCAHSRRPHAAGLIPNGGEWHCQALLLSWICFRSAPHVPVLAAAESQQQHQDLF